MQYVYSLVGKNEISWHITLKSKMREDRLLAKMQNKEPCLGFVSCTLEMVLNDHQHLCSCGAVVNTVLEHELCAKCRETYEHRRGSKL